MLVRDKRLGDDDVGSPNEWPINAGQREITVPALRSHPKRELSDLCAARINVHPVEVVRQDETGGGLSKFVESWVVLGECSASCFAPWALGVGVRLLVDRQQEIEGVEEEVAAAARRVEYMEGAWILLCARRECLAGLANHILAPLAEVRVRTTHFVPDSTECVVGEELDDVAWREELVADRQLSAVAGRLALAHFPALVLAVEELVNPPDRFVLAPYLSEFACVQDFKELLKRRALR